MNPLDLLASLGVPSQYLAYATAAIGVATIIVRVLPKPNANGVYKTGYDLLSRVANLTAQPSDIHTVPTVLPTPPAPPSIPITTIAMLLVAGLGLSGCAAGAATGGTLLGTLASTVGLTSQVVQAGQLVCEADGIYAALNTPVADPVTAKDQTAAFVAAACAAWKPNAIPVAPPAGAVVQAATVTPPAAS